MTNQCEENERKLGVPTERHTAAKQYPLPSSKDKSKVTIFNLI
jgi:hypothetical protein